MPRQASSESSPSSRTASAAAASAGPSSSPKRSTGGQMLQTRIEASQRVGVHATIYLGNGDTYKGEWAHDQMHGRGVYRCKADGSVYSGDFAQGKRQGQGTLMVPVLEKTPQQMTTATTITTEPTEQTKRQPVSASLAADADTAHLRLLYKGTWQNDHYQGKGTIYYDDGTVYQGDWVHGAQKGWGAMDYADGSRYEGEWQAGKRHGHGKLTLPNHDRYEGMWMNDLKEGPGRFIYKTRKQIYEGEWALGSPKCGSLRDMEGSPDPTSGHSPLPQLTLKDPQYVLANRVAEVVDERVQRVIHPTSLGTSVASGEEQAASQASNSTASRIGTTT